MIGCAENGALLFEKAKKCDINKQKTFRLRESHGMFYLLWQVLSISRISSNFHTLISVTVSGHVKYQKNPFPASTRHPIDVQWMFGCYVLCHWYMAFQLLQKHGKLSYKSQKGDWPCILHGHSQSCYWECRISSKFLWFPGILWILGVLGILGDLVILGVLRIPGDPENLEYI